MINKVYMKTCCGRRAVTYTVAKPIRRNHVQLFQDAGFLIPERYMRTGLFYGRKDGFTATCNFGITRITARCSGANCDNLFAQFETVLEKIQSS